MSKSECICYKWWSRSRYFYSSLVKAYASKNLIYYPEMRDSLKMYVRLSDRCFADCIDDFTSKSVGKKETACIEKCVDKFMKFSARAGMRFQEGQAELMQQQMQQAQ
eukprot:Partr_v1_DN21772_c0_g1_i2_m7630 putative mitochondrial import inner membrane translocase, subunit